MARILFVEDEQAVLDTLLKFFSREGFDVKGARTGTEALDLAERFPPDVAVLDVMLHEGPAGIDAMDGYEICRTMRDNGFDRPVLFLTARSGEQDKLVGFELGADDYVTKKEFRLMCSFLILYVQALDAFSAIDGGGAGVDENDDRRISTEEWAEHGAALADYGFVGLRAAAAGEGDAFDGMDADGRGMVLFGEWSDFLFEAEVRSMKLKISEPLNPSDWPLAEGVLLVQGPSALNANALCHRLAAGELSVRGRGAGGVAVRRPAAARVRCDKIEYCRTDQ